MFDRLFGLLIRKQNIELSVLLTPSDEVAALRLRVQQLTDDLERMQQKFNRTEYLYRCECIINARLEGFCEDHGIRVNPALFKNLE